MEAVLSSIASRLNDLSEKYLTDAIDQEQYAFGVHDTLQMVPTALAPGHIVILRRIKDWKEATLITAEQAKGLSDRVMAASTPGSAVALPVAPGGRRRQPNLPAAGAAPPRPVRPAPLPLPTRLPLPRASALLLRRRRRWSLRANANSISTRKPRTSPGRMATRFRRAGST